MGFGIFYFFTIPSFLVLLCTTKYYSSTTLYYKVLVQYYSVLQSTNARAHIFAFFTFYLGFFLLFLLFVLDLGFGKFYVFTIPSFLVLLCTTKYYSSTTLYYKVLVQYYSVLQSTNARAHIFAFFTFYLVFLFVLPFVLDLGFGKFDFFTTPSSLVLLCTTKYYSSTTLYYKPLFFAFLTFCLGLGIWKNLLCHHTFQSSTTLYYKVLLQYYSVLQSTSPILFCTTKY